MIENKRFTFNGVSIEDHAKKDLIYVGGNDNLSALAEYLDELQDEDIKLRKENNQLKKENSKLILDYNRVNAEYEWFKKENKDLRQMVDFYKDFQKDVRELEKENEELRQFKQLVFNLIDKSLKEDKRYYKMTYEDYLNGRIEALEELKKVIMND